jgi:hypothetical protein
MGASMRQAVVPFFIKDPAVEFALWQIVCQLTE